MKKAHIIVFGFVFFITSCDNGEKEEPLTNTITLTGTFETAIQGYSVYDLISQAPYLQFLPKTIQSNEDMGCPVKEDGHFSVELIKGETYNCLILGTAGYIKFSSVDGNELTVPEDAPGNYSLGTLKMTYTGVWLAENPLPWLTEGILDIKNHPSPVIEGIDKSELKRYNDSEKYVGSILTFEVQTSGTEVQSYIWVIEDIQGALSFSDNNVQTKILTRSDKAYVYTDNSDWGGKITVIAIDVLGGSTKESMGF